MLAITFAVVVAFGSGHAAADHLGHTGEVRILQVKAKFSEGNRLPENMVNKRWALEPASTTIRWYHDPDNTSDAYEALFQTAINNWTSQISQLKWEETEVESNADLFVRFKNKCSLGSAFFLPLIWDEGGWHSDVVRHANYWQKAEICFPTGKFGGESDTFKIAVLAHEIGHAYGLPESYKDSSWSGTGSTIQWSRLWTVET